MQTKMKNRRRHPRLSFTTEVWLGQDGIFTRTNECLSDLSVGGAFIEAASGYAVGSILSLRFRLSKVTSFITCTIAVRNTRGGCGLGVEFLDLSPEDCQRINSFIEEQLLSEVFARTRTALSHPEAYC